MGNVIFLMTPAKKKAPNTHTHTHRANKIPEPEMFELKKCSVDREKKTQQTPLLIRNCLRYFISSFFFFFFFVLLPSGYV